MNPSRDAIRRTVDPPAFTPRVLAWATLAWSLSAALEMSVLHFYLPISGQGAASWRGLAIWCSAPMVLWVLYTPLVVHLSRRFRILGKGAASALGVHAFAALLAHLGVAVLVYALYPWIRGEPRPHAGLAFLQGSLLDLLRYGMVVTAVTAADYHRLYRSREIDALRLTTELDAARLQVLKMQLQPHFLFNALHAISELVYRDPALADRALTHLADLLRRMLAAADRHEVPLADELAFLEAYLEIERIRRPEGLDVRIEAEPAALDGLVPNLILQPLVENALRHGIRGRAEGSVRIRARREGGALHLVVEDDGRGLADEFREGLGLGSSRTRLRALYGEGPRLTIRRREPKGTIVELILPDRRVPAPAIAGPAAGSAS